MDCRRIDSILDGHGGGALSAAERSEADAHLARCRRCADAWLSHETLLRDTPEPPADGLLERLAARALAAPRPLPPRPRRRALPLGLAAALATLGVLIFTFRPGEPPAPGAGDAATAASAGLPLGDPASGLPGQPDEARFVAGRDYERLAQRAPTLSAPEFIEVCGFFMFGCPHCFEFESSLEAWEQTQADDVALVRVPVLFNATARLHAQAYYTAEVLGQAEALRVPFYEEIHVRGNPLATLASVRELFARHGIDAGTFDRTFESPAVALRLERAEAMNRLYRVSATPSIGVNGSYLTHPGMVGSNEAMLEVVDALVASERRTACRESDGSRCPIE